jgi:hypothetical protein
MLPLSVFENRQPVTNFGTLTPAEQHKLLHGTRCALVARGADFHLIDVPPSAASESPSFQNVQVEIAARLHNRIIVGYALWHFLAVRVVPSPSTACITC